LIVDTGLETELVDGVALEPAHPRLKGHAAIHSPWTTAADASLPTFDQSRTDEDEKDFDADGFLDRQAGHGTFIAGIIRSIAPSAEIWTRGGLSSFGDGDDYDISAAIVAAFKTASDTEAGPIDLVNLSLGSFTEDDEAPDLTVLGDTIAAKQAQGTVFVAAAGNMGSCRRFWPAALPGVIGVGATHCGKKAWFSNFGPWVKACAPGVDIVSTFLFFSGAGLPIAGYDSDEYLGWAEWSGTSFAAPYVAAVIARRMCDKGEDALTAAAAVITDDPEPRVTVDLV
jgi:subtilisin family serine protease